MNFQVKKNITPFLIITIAAFSIANCKSSKAISKSMSASFLVFASSASSKAVANADKIYRKDVKDVAAIYGSKDLNLSYLSDDLDSLATKHGITNWQANRNTYLGIGQGFKKADLSQSKFDEYKITISKSNTEISKLLQTGFESI